MSALNSLTPNFFVTIISTREVGQSVKVDPLCAICLSSSVVKLVSVTKLSRSESFALIDRVLKEFRAEWSNEAVPADLGSRLARRVAELVGVEDPYWPLKRRAMESERAGLVSLLRERIERAEEGYPRFREAALLSAAANASEVGVQDHPVNPEEAYRAIVKAAARGFAIDHTREAYEVLRRARRVTLMTDNLGEFLVDAMLVGLLENMGKRVTVLAKPGPILDDVTVQEASELLPPDVRVVPSSTVPRLGFRRREATEEALRAINESDLVIAKGMGHYETLTEPEERLGIPTLLLLTAKCRPVAKSIGVELGSPVALLL